MYDAIVVGGGPAGLSAALVLGRARRRVLVVDGGEPRNAPAAAAHGVFTRDGTLPDELLRIGREQLRPFLTVELRATEATAAERVPDGFAVTLGEGSTERARKLILATGVRDELPDIPGFRELFGRGVFHCPYCHGWEACDQPLAVYANGEVAMHLAPLVRNWSADVVLLTDGPAEISADDRAKLAGLNIRIREERVARIEEEPDDLRGIVFASGDSLARCGMFVRPRIHPRTCLAEQLGCALVEAGGLPRVDRGRRDPPDDGGRRLCHRRRRFRDAAGHRRGRGRGGCRRLGEPRAGQGVVGPAWKRLSDDRATSRCPSSAPG